MLDAEAVKKLRDGIAPTLFDWRRGRCRLPAAALCRVFVRITALTRAKWVIALMLWPFGGKAIVNSPIFAATVLYIRGGKRRTLYPADKAFTNEAVIFPGVLSAAASITRLGWALDDGSGHFSLPLGLAAGCGLAALAWISSWYGYSRSFRWAAASGGGRTAMFQPGAPTGSGTIIQLVSRSLAPSLRRCRGRLEEAEALPNFSAARRAPGRLFLFVSLWVMSIFGNYGDLNSWYRVRRIELFH